MFQTSTVRVDLRNIEQLYGIFITYNVVIFYRQAGRNEQRGLCVVPPPACRLCCSTTAAALSGVKVPQWLIAVHSQTISSEEQLCICVQS